MAASAFVQFEFSDLSRIIVHTGMELCCPAKSEEMAMRALSFFFAGLAVAIISIAPANAEKTTKVEDTYKCSTTTWPVISPFQCNKLVATSYVEGVKMVTDKGWRPSDAWWGAAIRGSRTDQSFRTPFKDRQSSRDLQSSTTEGQP
jgi:hypothetical protein